LVALKPNWVKGWARLGAAYAYALLKKTDERLEKLTESCGLETE
jgi:hypothetical protein